MTNRRRTFRTARDASGAARREYRERAPRESSALSSARDEAQAIADRVAAWLAEGNRPEKIAVLFRSVATSHGYEDALLDREIPVCIAATSTCLPIVARSTRSRCYGTSTIRSVTIGCSARSESRLRPLRRVARYSLREPPDPQRPLFAFDEEPPPTTRSSRWNPKRDLRLGWNVIRGERDDALSAEAAARVARFRAACAKRWLAAMESLPFEEFARSVWREGLAREGEPGSARARAQQVVLRRLLDRLSGSSARSRRRNAGRRARAYAEERMDSDLESCAEDDGEGFVQLIERRGGAGPRVRSSRRRQRARRRVSALVRAGGISFQSHARHDSEGERRRGDARRAPQSSLTTCLGRKPRSITTSASGVRSPMP